MEHTFAEGPSLAGGGFKSGTRDDKAGIIGWSKELDAAEITHHFTKAVEDYFRPELFNRIDSVVPFRPLSRQTMRFVVEREIDLLKKQRLKNEFHNISR